MWYYKDELFDDILSEFDSFVYIIERLNILECSDSPIYYIGKKTFYNKTKHKGKRIAIESDWGDYYGSSDWLAEDIAKYGKHNFKRSILHLCRTKGDAGYLEAKEQIERNVLHVTPDGYKLYYNKNILGRYRNEPEFYKIEGSIKDYYNLDYIHGNNYKKKWVTNGKTNRLMNSKDAETLVCSSDWSYGRCEKHVHVNDGTKNYYIPKSRYTENTERYSLGTLSKYVTNGNKDKRLNIDDIPSFLRDNPGWGIGYSHNKNFTWITNGVEDKRVMKRDVEHHKGFRLGRVNIGVKNKISITKNDEFKWILECELEKYVEAGWKKKGPKGDYNLYIVTDGISQKHFTSKTLKDEFLSLNPAWRNGQVHRETFNTNDMVFAKHIETDEKVCVTKDEFKSRSDLVGVKTKKVKIKKSNRIIFMGYLEKFIKDNPKYSKTVFMEQLRNGDKTPIHKLKGPNVWMNDEKISVIVVN